jgi:hypothetical protein
MEPPVFAQQVVSGQHSDASLEWYLRWTWLSHGRSSAGKRHYFLWHLASRLGLLRGSSFGQFRRDVRPECNQSRGRLSYHSRECADGILPRNAQAAPHRSSQFQPDFFMKCVSRNWHKGKAVRGPGRMSSTPHSSASHQSSAVLEEVTSTIGMSTPLHLIRSTRSLQLPSGIASSVTTTVFSLPALSKPTAASMLLAHRITSPCASIPRAMAAAGRLVDTKIIVPAALYVSIDLSAA